MVELKIHKEFIKIIAKPTKSGPRYYFNIPAIYIKNGIIDPKKKYEIYITEYTEKHE